MAIMNLALKYSLFALLATLANLLVQEISTRLYSADYFLIAAMIFGTLAGLTSKYLLDKHYIFSFKASTRRAGLHTFLAYGLTGVLTTLLFWSFELSFDFWFGSKFARYLGAVIGLAIGYGVKYQLDKRYVFTRREV